MPRLEKLDESLWLADGETVSFYGFPYPTRSVIVRLSGDPLWVWSPIRLADDLRIEVDCVGRVAHLISPNKLHHLHSGRRLTRRRSSGVCSRRLTDSPPWRSQGRSATRRRPTGVPTSIRLGFEVRS